LKDSVQEEISGFRFYYMVYDKKAWREKKIRKEYRRIHSLIIVPTTKEGDYHKDQLIFVPGPEPGKRYILALTVENNGTACPPLPAPACKGTELMQLADKK